MSVSTGFISRPSSERRFFSWSHSFLPISLPPYQAVPASATSSLYSVYHQHGQTSYFSSCCRPGYGLSTGILQRVSTVKVLSVAVTLQITDFWYQRRELGDQVQSHGPLSSRLGRAVADFQSRGFVDAFDDLEARTFLSAQSVSFIYL